MSRVSLWVLHGRHFLYLKGNSSVSKNVFVECMKKPVRRKLKITSVYVNMCRKVLKLGLEGHYRRCLYCGRGNENTCKRFQFFFNKSKANMTDLGIN